MSKSRGRNYTRATVRLWQGVGVTFLHRGDKNGQSNSFFHVGGVMGQPLCAARRALGGEATRPVHISEVLSGCFMNNTPTWRTWSEGGEALPGYTNDEHGPTEAGRAPAAGRT